MSRYIIQDIKEYAAQGMTPKELRRASVFLVLDSKHPRYKVGNFSAYGWVIECKSQEGNVVVVPVTQIFAGILSDFKLYKDVCKPGDVWEWKDDYVSKDSFIPTKRKLLEILEAKFTNDGVWGYYDIITPITPALRESGRFFNWDLSWTKPGPPKIPVIRSQDPKVVDDVYNHMISALSKISKEPYINDTILMLADLRTFISGATPRGVLTLSTLVNSFLASWQKSGRTTQFSSILTSVYWPSYKPGLVEDRLKIWRESPQVDHLMVQRGIKKGAPSKIKNWLTPRRRLTRSQRRTISRNKDRLNKISKVLDVEEGDWEDTGSVESQSIPIFNPDDIIAGPAPKVDDLTAENLRGVPSDRKPKLYHLPPRPTVASEPESDSSTIKPNPLIKVNGKKFHCDTPFCVVCNGELMPETYSEWISSRKEELTKELKSKAQRFYESVPTRKAVGLRSKGWLDWLVKAVAPSDATHKKSERIFTKWLRKYEYHVKTDGLPEIDEENRPSTVMAGLGNFIGFAVATPFMAVYKSTVKQKTRFNNTLKWSAKDKFLKKSYRRMKVSLLLPVFWTLGIANTLLSGVGLSFLSLWYGCKNTYTRFKKGKGKAVG
ncbi:hypothetical protein [Sclerotinia sclerotiorum fusarivirus 1]|uniref:Uncharacterized protein n=1 Tax=Sclerotinia sclerotiorum fusarivirus 1 TaxID=1661062 RepID=A0A0G3BIC2_9VIRU|nr:hypothetical protein [Sclerotinia sclerotiorum fusarivirus 1]AKJ26310.1 hypothetical protein [Sclerotinia sclerotiorum fusarivirus 1]